jgi:predicted ATPase
MLRELVEALSLGTATHGLVLVLEDLQWSDASTVEFLAYMARRTGCVRSCG